VNVVEIRRYPVKAMAGESLGSALLDARGLVGDRRFAVIDDEGRMATGKDSRRFRRRDAVFDFRASTVDEGVRVQGRGGGWLVGDPALDEALSGFMGAHVRVVPEGEVSYFDASPVSLVGTASLDWWRTRQDVDADVRRLRTNLVVETTEPFVEETWTGDVIHVGEVELTVGERTERCRMVDIAQDGLPPEPGWLKALGRERELCLGVYADVRTPGRVTLGDEVDVVRMKHSPSD
jgi:uncharacterized protein YcbX